MTEMQAAMLSASLPDLDVQNAARLAAVDRFEAEISRLDGVRTLRRRNDARVDRPTFWHLPIQVDEHAFNGHSAESVRDAVSNSANLFLELVGAPLDDNPLYNPHLYRRFPPEHRATLDKSRAPLPVAEAISRTSFTVPHHALLAEPATLDRLVDAIATVQEQARRTSST
jgi:dTDP-4-amino-4,6-dideoxygalactose transaminase